MSPKYKHPDTSYDNLESRGFDLPYPLNTWKTTHVDTIRQKVDFDMQPTNPKLDIQPIGKCGLDQRGQATCSFQAGKDRSPLG